MIHGTAEARVLVIDDDSIILLACREVLEKRGLVVDTESDPFEGRDRALRGPYDVVLLDMRMPELDGFQILSKLREYRPDLAVIIITGYSSIDSAVKAVKLGAFDYLPKPFTPDELTRRVEEALRASGSRAEAGHATGTRRQGQTLIGDSEAMGRVRSLINRIAPTDATVLVVGESGTGKELVANAIHLASRRADKPFVSLDCSALAPGLLESELFGHVKGAFTGAMATKPGLFEVADRGTLFLDEVSNLSLETQGKLLRVLETGEIRPVGGVESKSVHIRLVAATNRDLSEMVSEKSFREDLYYRLNVVPVLLPPLRVRPSDIAQLLCHFLAQYQKPGLRGPQRISRQAIDVLLRYPWPGNVRELRNLMERLVVTVEEETVRPEHLPDHIAKLAPAEPATFALSSQDLKAMKRASHQRVDSQIERAFVIEALRRNGWNISRAAAETGMLRPNFHALMKKHGIRVESLKE